MSYINVTLPPEMSHIATRSLLGYSNFPKGGVPCIDFDFSAEPVSPVFSNQKTYTCHTHKRLISVINNSMYLKEATLQ